MAGSKKASWITGTALAALVIMAGGWFLLVAPVFAATAETRAQVEAVNASNEQLSRRIVQLAAQFEKLDDYKGELAALRAQIPTDAQQTAYFRELAAIADANGVTLTSLAPSDPEAFNAVARTDAGAESELSGAGVSAEDAASQGEAADPTADEAEAAPEPVAPVGLAAPAGMVDVQMTLSAVGTYDAVLAFVQSLQTGTTRLFLLTNIQATSLTDADAAGGRPATKVGDLEVQLSGMVFVLPDPAGAAAVDPEAPVAALPGAVAGKNPMVPLG